jgi:WhiB family redox-sensing transcriptional regulator
MTRPTQDSVTEATGKTGWRPRAALTAGSWRARAACLQLDSGLFFPDRVTYLKKDIAAAKAACCRCPVREECLQAAVDGGEKVGIWGGLTPIERMNLHRRQRRVRAAQERPAAHEVSTQDR